VSNELTLFTIVPNEVLLDRRLTLTHMRVLIALLSFRNKHTNVMWPGRVKLALRCGGIDLNKLSVALTQLCALGWFSKERSGRKFIFTLTVPHLTESVSSHLTESVSSHIEQINEQITEHTSVADKQRPQGKIVFDDSQNPHTLLNVCEEQMHAWQSAFPRLDIDGELTRIELWLSANPTRRKKNYERFIAGWLTRAADNAAPRTFIKQTASTL
jgi:hypothetical protein